MTTIRRSLRVLAIAAIAALVASCNFPGLGTPSRQQQAAALPVRVTVKSGDTVSGIAYRYGVTTQAMIDANGLRPPYTVYPGQELRLPLGGGHTVRRGDSLYAISRQYRVEVGELARVNGLRPPYTIYVGQQLVIPAPTPAPAVVAARPEPATDTATAAPVSKSLGPPPPPRRPTSVAGRTGSQTPVPPRPPDLAAARERQIALPAIPAPQARSQSGFQWPVSGEVVSRFGPKSDGRHNDGVNIAARAGTPVVAADNGVVAYAGNELRGYGNLVLIRHDGDWVTAYGHAERLLVSRGDRVRAGERIATVGKSGAVATPQLHFEIRQGAVAVDPLKHLPRNPDQVGRR